MKPPVQVEVKLGRHADLISQTHSSTIPDLITTQPPSSRMHCPIPSLATESQTSSFSRPKRTCQQSMDPLDN